MEITKQFNGKSLNIAINGRIDTTTSPELEKVITESIKDITELTLDFANVEYVSSAGLRVILQAQKTMSHQGTMTLINVKSEIKDIFDMTGFSEILNIL